MVLFTDPLSPQEHVTLAGSYLAEGRADLAEKEYKAASWKDKRCVPGWAGLGNLAFDRQDWKRARKYYKKSPAGGLPGTRA